MPYRALLAGLLVVIAASNGFAQDVGDFSIAPLLEPPAIPYQAVPEQLKVYTAQLKKRYPTLSTTSYVEVRERGDLLVDSILKQRAIEGRAEFTDAEREWLHELFGWAAKLGAYGADQVAAYFAPENTVDGEPGPQAPAPFQVVLEYPHVVVSAGDAAWRLRCPFYFTIGGLDRSDIEGGRTMSSVSLRTSLGQESDGGSHSAATIVFAHSADANPEAFNAMWLRRYSMQPLHEADSSLPGARNFRIDELRLNLHIELTLLNDATGCYAVLFIGRGGAYESNRVSYLDFLRHMQTAEVAAD